VSAGQLNRSAHSRMTVVWMAATVSVCSIGRTGMDGVRRGGLRGPQS
jgi:hypothetical protein